jgi:hypothetical protein
VRVRPLAARVEDEEAAWLRLAAVVAWVRPVVTAVVGAGGAEEEEAA